MGPLGSVDCRWFGKPSLLARADQRAVIQPCVESCKEATPKILRSPHKPSVSPRSIKEPLRHAFSSYASAQAYSDSHYSSCLSHYNKQPQSPVAYTLLHHTTVLVACKVQPGLRMVEWTSWCTNLGLLASCAPLP
jgi:hypothetical protein